MNHDIIEAAPRAVAIQSATPADLVRIAVEQGADLDRLERLMAMQETWERREAEKAYNVAFSAFKAEAVQVIKNRKVTDGPLKNKSYAELFSVVNAVTPALSKHGLSASWRITRDEKDWIEVTCSIKHVLGHAETVAIGGPPDTGGAKNAIQARASTITYLERYTLKAICGVSEQEDDDDGQGGPKKTAFDANAAIVKVLTATTLEEAKVAFKAGVQAAAAAKDLAGRTLLEESTKAHRAKLNAEAQGVAA